MVTRCEVVDYDTRGGETYTSEFLQSVNPDGKVPVLELQDGTMLPESGAILYYLAEGTPYLPEQKLERARVLRWMFSSNTVCCPTSPGPVCGACRVWRSRPKEGPSWSISSSRATGPSV